jgi:hypothetical protein
MPPKRKQDRYSLAAALPYRRSNAMGSRQLKEASEAAAAAADDEEDEEEIKETKRQAKRAHTERVKRSTTQGLLLLDTFPDEMRFHVQGSTGAQYNVWIGMTSSCTCPDFERRHRKCKHILFILHRVLGLNEQELEDIGPDPNRVLSTEQQDKLRQKATAFIDKQRAKRPDNRVPDDECGICMEAFTALEITRECTVCWHAAHANCLHHWHLAQRTSHAACPYCRAVAGMGAEQKLHPTQRLIWQAKEAIKAQPLPYDDANAKPDECLIASDEA